MKGDTTKAAYIDKTINIASSALSVYLNIYTVYYSICKKSIRYIEKAPVIARWLEVLLSVVGGTFAIIAY